MNILCYHSIAYKTYNEVFKNLKLDGHSFNLYGIIDAVNEDLDYKRTHSALLEVPNLEFEDVSIESKKMLEYELKYKLSSSGYIHSERNFFGFDKSLKRKYGYGILNRVIEFVVDNKIDAIVCYSFAGSITYLLYELAKSLNIPFYYAITSRLGEKMWLSDDPDTGPANFEEIFKKNLKLAEGSSIDFDTTEEFVNDYISKRAQPYYMNPSFDKSKGKNFIQKGLDVLNKFWSVYQYTRKNSTSELSPSFLQILKNQVVKKRNVKEYHKFNEKHSFQEGFFSSDKYFIYPLHFHPEGATLIQGRWLNDQYIIIEMISKALPSDVTLVVKEHRVAIGLRDISFFEKINALHNVNFVSHNANPYDLIAKSQGVFTLSSSMGLEAILMDKAVVSFGDVFYNKMPGVFLAHTISELEFLVKEALLFKGYQREKKLAFIHTLLEVSFEGFNFDVHNPNENSTEAIKNEIGKKLFFNT